MTFDRHPGYIDRGVSAIPEPPLGPWYICGLDLGQTMDFSALAILELPSEHIRHLGRWELGTPYTKQVDDCRDLLHGSMLCGRTTLVVDATGAGRPVIDMMRARGLSPVPIVITGGWAVQSTAGYISVPKRDLVAALAMGSEASVLVAPELEYAPVLRREIANFRAKITTSGHDTYEAWREGQHDDLVLAAALAIWWSRKAGHFTLADRMLAPKGADWKAVRP